MTTSLGEANAKFPGQGTGLPPQPTRENPGGVFPRSDPSPSPKAPTPRSLNAETYVGNPFLMKNALEKVDHSIRAVIAILQNESASQSRQAENPLLAKFESWRDELSKLRTGESIPTPRAGAENSEEQEGGLFVD